VSVLGPPSSRDVPTNERDEKDQAEKSGSAQAVNGIRLPVAHDHVVVAVGPSIDALEAPILPARYSVKPS